MLTQVLMTHLLRTAGMIVPGVGLVVYFTLGRPDAVATLIGGAIFSLSGAGLVYLVGKLLDPRQKGPAKMSFMAPSKSHAGRRFVGPPGRGAVAPSGVSYSLRRAGSESTSLAS